MNPKKGKKKADVKNSTPLHIMCQTLAAMKNDLKSNTAKKTVYIGHIPASMATEAKLREKLKAQKFIRNLEADVEW